MFESTTFPIEFLADDRLDRIDVPSLDDCMTGGGSGARWATAGLPDDVAAELEAAFGYDRPTEYTDDDMAAIEADRRRQAMEAEAREVF